MRKHGFMDICNKIGKTSSNCTMQKSKLFDAVGIQHFAFLCILSGPPCKYLDVVYDAYKRGSACIFKLFIDVLSEILKFPSFSAKLLSV